ncbi:MAG: uridine diphosphate-N-acetylglucosamine-binding protein YvcK [Candidatus Omnitrophica bacterium]|nr:uridine diphosphate-N-acetylglucosamine-binding protein YvcK [Candidatus Omnitrophota bacterium]
MAHILVAENNTEIIGAIKLALRRFGHELSFAKDKVQVIRRLKADGHDLVILDTDVIDPSDDDLLKWQQCAKEKDEVPVLLLVSERAPDMFAKMDFRPRDRIAMPFNPRELVSRVNAILRKEVRVSCIGGGTGLYTLLMGLKTLSSIHLFSIVSMSDDGGSAGRLREAYGILPPGDVRRSLVALSAAPRLMNKMLTYRFEKGKELRGHNLGNVILTALSNITGSMVEAVRGCSELLNVKGIVLPVTTTLNILKAELEDGTIIEGEAKIDVPASRDPRLRIARLWQEPSPYANPDAVSALLHSEIITIGPGDLFTSLISNLIISEIAEAIRRSRAKKIYITNLMTKPGETTGYTASEHIAEINKYLGGDYLDYVIVSNSKLSKRSVAEYKKKNQEPVRIDPMYALRRVTKAKIVYADITSEADLVRHDSLKLAKAISNIIKKTV